MVRNLWWTVYFVVGLSCTSMYDITNKSLDTLATTEEACFCTTAKNLNRTNYPAILYGNSVPKNYNIMPKKTLYVATEIGFQSDHHRVDCVSCAKVSHSYKLQSCMTNVSVYLIQHDKLHFSSMEKFVMQSILVRYFCNAYCDGHVDKDGEPPAAHNLTVRHPYQLQKCLRLEECQTCHAGFP